MDMQKQDTDPLLPTRPLSGVVENKTTDGSVQPQTNNYASVDQDQRTEKEQENLSLFTITAILSTAFSYGCIMTTLFLITLPVECERVNLQHPGIPKSVALGIFVTIAGVTQLVSPLVGKLSDSYLSPVPGQLGQRLPYLVLGSVATVAGLLGQMIASAYGFWIRYSFAFFGHMIGLNIMYAMMIALIPDQVPAGQTGIANGILGLFLTTGSLFGFGLFHSVLGQKVSSMYALYTCIVIFTSILTGTHAHDMDAEIAYYRTRGLRRKRQSLHQEESADSYADSGVEPDDGESRDERPGEDLTEEQSSKRSIVVASPDQPRWKRARRRAHQFTRHAAQKAKEILLTPTIILRSMLVDPFKEMDWKSVMQAYTIDIEVHHDFTVVTLSRLCYYCGQSVQTFFLYYLHDVIGIRDNVEATVASLAILGQCTGAITCYPVGFLSDRCLGGQRRPLVYLACSILAACVFALILLRTLDQMVVVIMVFGAANGMYLTIETSLAVDSLHHEGGGDTSSAQLLGIWGVAAFLGAALGPMIGGPLLYLVGGRGVKESNSSQDSVEAEEYSIEGYAVVLGLSTIYFILSALTLCYMRQGNKH